MKIFFFAISAIFLTHRQSDAGVVRKQPAFATPVYSNSYLPAAMQVIFHAVEQLKHLEAEEMVSTSPTTTQSIDPSVFGTSIASIAYMASTLSTDVTTSKASSTSEAVTTAIAMSEASSVPEPMENATVPQSSMDSIDLENFPDSSASTGSDVSTTSTSSDSSVDSTNSGSLTDFATTEFKIPASWTVPGAVITSTVSQDSTASTVALNPTGSTPNFINTDTINASQSHASVLKNIDVINEELPKIIDQVTATSQSKAETPEKNYATPEVNHEVQETGQEEIESNQEIPEKISSDPPTLISLLSRTSETSNTSSADVASKQKRNAHYNKYSSEENWDENSSFEDSGENSGESDNKKWSESGSDEDDSSEEEDDEIRFTMIGEKVSQIPRPSLTNYLRKTARAPLRSSVQDLATLYDALSKDARKQGLAKYAGYSDEVLRTLESSIEGGVGPQLQTLLEKAQERNEVTRDDTKRKIAVTLKKLADPASIISRDLRRLIPLRYIP